MNSFFVLFVNELDAFLNVGLQLFDSYLNQFLFVLGYFADAQASFDAVFLFINIKKKKTKLEKNKEMLLYFLFV